MSTEVKPLAAFGVDPGLTNGLTYLLVHLDGHVTLEHQVECGVSEVTTILRGWIVDAQVAGYKVIVGLERFTSGQQASKHTAQPDAERVVGMVQDLCRELKAKFIMQSPGDAKKLAPNAFLRALSWSAKGREHANDSMRHALMAISAVRATALAKLMTKARWVGG